jgi:hypothetical protein
MELFDKDGNAVEGAMLPDEVNAKLTEKDNSITELQKKIDDAASKGTSIVELRKQLDAAKTELDGLKTSVISQLGDFAKQQGDKELDSTVSRIAEGDSELAKKIKDTYEAMVKTDDTDEVKRKKLGDAYKVNVTSASPDILQSVVGSAGAPPANAGENPGNFPEAVIALGARMGLTRDDFKNKKYVKK